MSLYKLTGSMKPSLLILTLTCAYFVLPQNAYSQDASPEPFVEEFTNVPSDAAQVPAEASQDLDFLTSDVESQVPEQADIMPIPQTQAEDVTQVVPLPEAEELAAPQEIPQEAIVELQPDIPSLVGEDEVDENLFFDANDFVPTGEMGKKGGPRKVNPATEPASKLIVVKKNARADSHTAQLVSADRALKLGRYGAALEMYDRLHAKSRRDPNILMGRAIALQNLGRDEEAILAYQALLDLRPANLEAEINMLGLMGQSYPAVALQRLMELRETNPGSVGVVGQIAVIEAELGRYNEALQFLGIAASMEPQNANHLFNIAVIADRAGNKKEAVSYYEQALEIDSIYGGGRTIPRESVYERLAHIR